MFKYLHLTQLAFLITAILALRYFVSCLLGCSFGLTVYPCICVCVPGGSIDVNLLLTRLLAKGMIVPNDSSQSDSPPPATVTSSVVTDDAAATEAFDVCVHC